MARTKWIPSWRSETFHIYVGASVEMVASDWMLVDDDDDVCVKGLSSLTADKAPD